MRWKGCFYQVKHLVQEDSSSDQTLIFLHDALGSISQWKSFPQALCSKCRVNGILIERQGHGSSSPFIKKRKKNYLQKEAWKVLPELLRLLTVKNPVLVGHSDGGTIALLYGAKYQVHAIISIAAHIFVEDITRQSIQKAIRNQQIIKNGLVKYHGDKTDQLFKAWSATWLSEKFSDFNIEKELEGIVSPLLLIQSEDDEYGSMEQIERIKMNVQSNTVETYLPTTGGHAPHLTDEHKIVELISDFLNTIGK